MVNIITAVKRFKSGGFHYDIHSQEKSFKILIKFAVQ